MPIGDAAFMGEATPLLKSLARLSEVTVFADDAAFADASSDSPVAVVGATRLALHVKIDRAAETARLTKEIDRLAGEIAKVHRQARQRKLRRPRAGGGGRSGEEAPRRVHGDSESASRSASAPGIVDLKSAGADDGASSSSSMRRATAQALLWRDSRVVEATRGVTCSVSMP